MAAAAVRLIRDSYRGRRLIVKTDDRSRDGESMMSRIGLLCAAIALGVLSSPSTAQQTTPEQPLPPTQQAAPSVPPAPPPDTQTPETQNPETPPPFPLMPSAPPRHRWVDMGHHRAHAHHHAGHVRRSASHASERVVHPTRKTMRRCRSMNSRQLMHHRACRTLMQHQLHPAHHHHHQVSHRHSGAHRRTGAQRHSLRRNRLKHRRT